MRFALEGDLVIVINAMLVGKYGCWRPARRRAQEGSARAGPGAGASRAARSCTTWTTSAWARSTWRAPPTRSRSRSTASWASTCCRRRSRARRSARSSRKRRDQVRMFLMDKRALASIGNAYADEILFAAGIHPKTFCNKLTPAEADALYAAIPSVLRRRDRRDRAPRPADRREGARLPVGARARRQAVPALRHQDPRGARRRRRRLLLPDVPARRRASCSSTGASCPRGGPQSATRRAGGKGRRGGGRRRSANRRPPTIGIVTR